MRLSTPTFIVAILVLLGGVVALNVAMNGPIAGEESEQQAQSQEPPEPSVEAGTLVRMPPVVEAGAKDAPNKVVLGWSWTPEVQADPAKMAQVIEAVKAMGGERNYVRIVNVDLEPGTPLGLVVNGATIMPMPESGVMAVSNVMQALGIALNRPPRPGA